MGPLRIVQGLCLFALLVWPKFVTAEEELKVWWARTPPSIEGISGGKLKVGDKITKHNVELVNDYMPETFYLDTLDGAEWEITAYTPGEELMPQAMIKATKENVGKAVISPTGTVTMADGSAWIGGFPVPEAKTGLDVMVNRQFRATDGQADIAKGLWVNSSGEIYKRVVARVRIVNVTGRVSMDPRPSYPGFENQLSRLLFSYEEPYELKGTQLLSITYVDQDQYPDAWLYSPQQRRILRLSSGQRHDSLDGSLVRTGDIEVFSDPLGLWNFELVERKFLFSVIVGPTQGGGFRPISEDLEYIRGDKSIYPRGARLELRDTFVVEATPRIDYRYSKKLLYIDAATYWSSLGEFFDKEGKLLENNSLWFQRGENEYGPYAALIWILNRNYQNNQAVLFQNEYYIRNPPKTLSDLNMFTLKHITTQSR